MIRLTKYNEVYLHIDAPRGVLQEMWEDFSFYVPGAHFTPKFKSRMWDGRIRLLNLRTQLIYFGLLSKVQAWLDERSYEDEYHYELRGINRISGHNPDMSLYMDSMTPRDFQIEALENCISQERSLVVSPTGSGKSYIIYGLANFFKEQKILIIVPTISLVSQMTKDFIEYGFDDTQIHNISSGKDKQTDKRVVISTWQSLHRLKKEYFDQYDVVIGDECHLFKAKSLCSIMEKLDGCRYRFGFTGTLDGTITHEWVLTGLFGEVFQSVKTAELIEKKILSDFSIKCIVLDYNDDEKKHASKLLYKDEVEYLCAHERRNKFICNLAINLEGNTLLLFQRVEKHGKILYNMIKDKTNEEVHFIHGGVKGEERERIRELVDISDRSIIVASYGTFSTGINIRNLHNVLFASPSKSRIRNLQSIGRGLRRGDAKSRATLYDVADNLQWKKKVNHTLNHYAERIKLYNQEKFEYKLFKVKI